jgi:glutamyl endopeptidase
MNVAYSAPLVALGLGLLVSAEAGSVEFYSSTSVFTPPADLPVVDAPLNRSLALEADEAQELFVTVITTPDGRLERRAPSRLQIGELMSLLQAERWERLGSGKGAARTKVERGRIAGDDGESAWNEIDLLHEQMMTPETVIGDDTRQQVFMTTEFPFRAVGRISMADSSCTGTLIGPRHVLTAGHCVYNIDTDQWYEGLEFTPGQEGPQPALRHGGRQHRPRPGRLGHPSPARVRHRDADPRSGHR